MRKNPTPLIKLPPKAKILIQRADRLGDMVLALPVIEALKKAYPDATIDVLCSGISSQLLENHPLVNTVIKKTGFWETLKRIKYSNYDVYVCLWYQDWAAFLGLFAKIPLRLGDKVGLGKWLFTHPTYRHFKEESKHETQFNLDLLSPLGIHDQPPIVKAPKPKTKVSVPFSGKTVCIFCDAGGSNTAIPEYELLKLTQEILNQTNLSIILCYGKINKPTALTQFKHPRVHNVSKNIGLDELCAYIYQADYYIGADTGPSHIASFYNKKMVVYFGNDQNSPERWGPLSDLNKVIHSYQLFEELEKIID